MTGLPLPHILRSLMRSPDRTMQLVAGAAVISFLVCGALSWSRGMALGLAGSAQPGVAVLLGAGSEESFERSQIDVAVAGMALASIPGIRSDAEVPALSPEVHHMAVPEIGGVRRRQALVRGVVPAAIQVHAGVRIVAGRWPGLDEVLAGELAYRSIGCDEQALLPGSLVTIEGRTLTVSGILAAPGSTLASELWMPLAQLQTLTRRDSLSCVAMALDDPSEADLFAATRLDLELAATTLDAYYGRLAKLYAPVRGMAVAIAVLVALGGLIAGITALHAATAARVRELATLRAIGFRRHALVRALVAEALIASAAGTVIGCAAAVLLLDAKGVHFATTGFTLAVDGGVVIAAISCAFALAILGGLPPAIACVLRPIPGALRSP